jgi:hypothetical protein
MEKSLRQHKKDNKELRQHLNRILSENVSLMARQELLETENKAVKRLPVVDGHLLNTLVTAFERQVDAMAHVIDNITDSRRNNK